MTAGTFITFEGGEGAGKSTQAKLLAARIEATGRQVLLTREPGGSPFAEQVRRLILDPATAPHAPISETLLFYAARADHLDKTIRPALAAGKWVICDRFSDSTSVYQGAAGGVADVSLAALEAMVVAPTVPALTLLLDLTAEAGLARAATRRDDLASSAIDPYEARGIAFHQRLRKGFLAIAAAEPERCVVVNANRGIDAIAADIWTAVSMRLLGGKV